MDYLYTLFQITFLELLTYVLVIQFFVKTDPREALKKISFLVLPMNAITHPLFFFFIMGLPINFLANILIGECIVTIAEGFFLHRIFSLSAPKALALSAIVNLVSWQLGPLFTYLIKT